MASDGQLSQHVRVVVAIGGGTLVGWLIAKMTGLNPSGASLWIAAGLILVIYMVLVAVATQRGRSS